MNVRLRTLVRGIVNEALKGDVVNFAEYSGTDLDASCNHCSQALWLVWEQGKPATHWTECGGIGEGSCAVRAGDDSDDRGCAVCDKVGSLGAEGTCKMCERMLIRIKMMDDTLDDESAIAYARSLRVNKK